MPSDLGTARRVAPSARAAGFTLIELMIAVAVIALLAAVALPSYQSSVMKARRSDARSALVRTAQFMERYATEKGASGYATATLNDTPGATVVARATSDDGYYLISLPAATLTATTFVLNATPRGAQAADLCGTLTIDERGVRSVRGTTRTAAECW